MSTLLEGTTSFRGAHGCRLGSRRVIAADVTLRGLITLDKSVSDHNPTTTVSEISNDREKITLMFSIDVLGFGTTL